MYMPFLLSTGAEGSVKIRNSNRSETPKRDKHCVQIELFSVQSKNNRMVFSEHNKKQVLLFEIVG